MQKVIQMLPDLQEEAARFVATLTPTTHATLVTLSGELGAGKTAFIKAAAKALGVEETVNSPTFVLEKIYLLPEGRTFKRLLHIDAYRLEQGSELTSLGFDESMKDPGNLVMLEWPERVRDALPKPAATISFTVNSDTSRSLVYE